MRLKILFLFIASVALLTSRIHAHVEDEDDEAKVETEDDDVIVTSTETINSEADDVLYISPESHPDVFLAEHFDEENEEDFYAKWIKSQVIVNLLCCGRFKVKLEIDVNILVIFSLMKYTVDWKVHHKISASIFQKVAKTFVQMFE